MNGRFRAAKMFAVLFITTLLTFNWFFLPVDAKITTTRDAPQVFSVASAESCSVNPLGVANDFNVFMLGDLTQERSDAEGRVAAAGNVSLSSYGIGDKLSPDSSRDDLIVGGDLTYTNGEVFNGNAVYGGTADMTGVGFPNGDHRQGSPMDFADAEAYLLDLSAAWADLPANGETVVKPWGAIELNGDDADLNVFALSGADLADTNSFTINVPAGSTVLVNVDGSTAGMQNFEYFFEGSEYVLYNFFEATDLTFSSIGIQGTVLAPQADIVFNNGQINGTMIGAGLEGTGEFHHNLFAGCLPVPEEEEEPTATSEPTTDYQLNLSHISCAEDDDAPAGVEVHFVLLNVEDGITPGAVTYTPADGSSFEVEPTKNSGNVWHYFDYQPDGYYDVQSAEVDVDGVTVTLHNPGDYAGDYECSAEPTAEPTVAPTDVPANTLKPITECVANNGDGTYTAHFGYLNNSSEAVSIPVGPGNRFSPDPQDRGQPTVFEPGRTPYWPDTAFNMVFDADETLVWTLNGKTATASKNGVPCSYHVFLEKEWYDVDGNLMDAPPAEVTTDYAITVEGDLGTGTCSYPAGSDSLECTYDNAQPPALDNKGLWVPFGEAYTVTETGLPDGWEAVAGVGEFTAGDGYCETGRDGFTKYCTHTVENQAVVLPTETPEPTASPEPYVEPEFLACPAGLEEVGTFADYVRRDKAPKSHTYDLNLDSDAMITVVGLVKEGHPEVGCPGGSRCEQGQMQEEFDLAINGEVIGAYTDQGNVDAWFEIGPWETEAVVPMDSDEMVTTHLHINDGRGAESVDYKLTVCAEPVETPTATPEPQPDPKVEFDDPDTALCVLDPSDLIVTGNVTLPNDIESARLQLTWHVVHPADLRTEKIYKSITDVPDGYTFEVDSTFFGVDYLWPGVRPGDEVVEIHFGAMLLDSVTGNPIMDMGAGLDYYWYPWVCDAPTPTVEPTNEPEPIDNWPSGNAEFECTQIGDYDGAYKIDAAAPNGTYAVDGDGDTITVSNSDGKVFDWNSTFGIGAVIVKAGQGANVWYYDPQATSDTGLYAYENKDISHVTFCWQDPSVDPTSTPEPTETPEIGVCVPGPIDFNYDADGNPIPAGTVLNEQWAKWGVHISGEGRGGRPNEVIAFDSNNPTAMDTDLGTPNEDFGGPGVGNGGAAGKPGENANPQWNMLILPENLTDNDGDGLVDTPNDSARGGDIYFTFDQPYEVDLVKMIDIDGNEDDNYVEVLDMDGNLIKTVYFEPLGDNSYQEARIDVMNAGALHFFLRGSGSIAAIIFCEDDTPTPTATNTPTNTPVPPTATNTPTNTPVPPTATNTPTNTPVPPTATNTPTNTPVPPTATNTPTNTPVPPTATNTPTNTPVPPTATNTPTNTPVPPTATNTPTNTPVPPTATNTPTNTPVPPTATNTPTNTPVPPTATNTPTNTPTATNTPTNTPTATNTPTNTPVPPTATNTPTNTPVPPTATNTPTNTPTATNTPTNTPVPPTATNTPTSTPEPLGAIGDFIWEDYNANGVYDPSYDWSAWDAIVELYLDDGDNIWEPGGDDVLLETFVTGDDGLYLFTELEANTYWVYVNTEVEQDWYQNWIPTTDNPHMVELAPGEVYLDADIGLYDPSST